MDISREKLERNTTEVQGCELCVCGSPLVGIYAPVRFRKYPSSSCIKLTISGTVAGLDVYRTLLTRHISKSIEFSSQVFLG